MDFINRLSWTVSTACHGLYQPLVMDFINRLPWTVSTACHGLYQPLVMECINRLPWTVSTACHEAITKWTRPTLLDQINHWSIVLFDKHPYII